MDLSKLPKLSETKAREGAPATTPLEPPAATPAVGYEPRRFEPTGIGGEVWFEAIMGVILILYAPQFGKYLLALVTRQPFHTGVEWTVGPNTGSEVPYTQLEGGTFYSDSSLFLFGTAMLISAVAQAALASRVRAKRSIAWAAFGCMLAATVYCVVAVGVLFHEGVTPLISLLCAGVGGYVLYSDWGRLRVMG